MNVLPNLKQSFGVLDFMFIHRNKHFRKVSYLGVTNLYKTMCVYIQILCTKTMIINNNNNNNRYRRNEKRKIIIVISHKKFQIELSAELCVLICAT